MDTNQPRSNSELGRSTALPQLFSIDRMNRCRAAIDNWSPPCSPSWQAQPSTSLSVLDLLAPVQVAPRRPPRPRPDPSCRWPSRSPPAGRPPPDHCLQCTPVGESPNRKRPTPERSIPPPVLPPCDRRRPPSRKPSPSSRTRPRRRTSPFHSFWTSGTWRRRRCSTHTAHRAVRPAIHIAKKDMATPYFHSKIQQIPQDTGLELPVRRRTEGSRLAPLVAGVPQRGALVPCTGLC